MKIYGQRAVVETNRRPTPSSHRNKYKWMLETRCRGESERESMGRRGKENTSARLSHLEEETKNVNHQEKFVGHRAGIGEEVKSKSLTAL